MKWQSFMSTFVLNKMCDLISSGVRTDKGFKEVHLNTVAKQLLEFCGIEVSSTQVYNHLRKWRARWIQVSKLRDLSGASWDQGTCTIILEAEHYTSHTTVSSRPSCLNLSTIAFSRLTTVCFFLRITPRMLSS